jgi:hypothetical protein
VSKSAGHEGGLNDEPTLASTPPDVHSTRPNRIALLAAYKDTAGAIEALLFRLDPMGINFEDNMDEYRPEAESIARRLIKGRPASRQAVLPIVLGEFAHWFGDFAVRPPYSYDAVVDEVWACWLERKIG